MRILITGGAGFIGRHTARECVAQGHSVQIYDCYAKQIHGQKSPAETNAELRSFILGPMPRVDAELDFVQGDVCDAAALKRCLHDKDAVIHLAAETGTGQSMYEVTHYERVNIGGTAVLAENLASGAFPRIRKVVLASSRAVYGEGQYSCARCGPVFPPTRETKQLLEGRFDPICSHCGSVLTLAATREDAPRTPCSFYGLTKSVQEDILKMYANESTFALFVLRYQNVYGAMQSLRNPYTGIISIFTGLAREGKPINVFEDGLESRDFVHVEDIARANVRCLEQPLSGVQVLNLGSGNSTTVLDVANTIVGALGSKSPVEVSGQFRIGDIRHARANIAAASRLIGFEPRVSFPEGIRRFIDWVLTQETGASVSFERSLSELSKKGLLLTKQTQNNS